MKCQIFILFVQLWAFAQIDGEESLSKIEVVCGRPQDAIVETDPTKHRYIPYMIKIPRCRGTFKGYKPSIKRCAPSSSVNVSYEAIDSFTGKTEVISVIKHTQCTGECVWSKESCTKFEDWNPRSCQCKCKYSVQPPPNACEIPQVWKKDKCNCGCPMLPKVCRPTKEWNEDVCECTCKKIHFDRCALGSKVMNTENCLCMPEYI